MLGDAGKSAQIGDFLYKVRRWLRRLQGKIRHEDEGKSRRSFAKHTADMHGISVKVNVFHAPVEATVASRLSGEFRVLALFALRLLRRYRRNPGGNLKKAARTTYAMISSAKRAFIFLNLFCVRPLAGALKRPRFSLTAAQDHRSKRVPSAL